MLLKQTTVVTRSISVALKQTLKKTTGEILAITGTSLSGTVKSDGTTTITVVFKNQEVCHGTLQQILLEVILTAHNKRLNKQ